MILAWVEKQLRPSRFQPQLRHVNAIKKLSDTGTIFRVAFVFF